MTTGAVRRAARLHPVTARSWCTTRPPSPTPCWPSPNDSATSATPTSVECSTSGRCRTRTTWHTARSGSARTPTTRTACPCRASSCCTAWSTRPRAACRRWSTPWQSPTNCASTTRQASICCRTTVVRFRFRDDDTELDLATPDRRRRSSRPRHRPALQPADGSGAADVGRRHPRRISARVGGWRNCSTTRRTRSRSGSTPGEAMIFSNDRVLHGRTEFDLNEGNRHLQGCYIDHDAPLSRYRVLARNGHRTTGD